MMDDLAQINPRVVADEPPWEMDEPKILELKSQAADWRTLLAMTREPGWLLFENGIRSQRASDLENLAKPSTVEPLLSMYRGRIAGWDYILDVVQDCENAIAELEGQVEEQETSADEIALDLYMMDNPEEGADGG